MPNPGGHTAVGAEVEASPRRLSLATVAGGVLGVLWLLPSMFVVGFGIFLSAAARDIDSDSGLAWFCVGLGILTWALGLALAALYLMALVRRQYLSALLAIVAPLAAGTVVIFGPTNAADFWGGVPTPTVAALAAVIVLTAVAAVAFRICSAPDRDDALPVRGGANRMPSALGAILVGAGALVLTIAVIAMSAGPEGWFRESPWGVVAWVSVLTGIWFLAYRLWRRSGTPPTGSRHNSNDSQHV